MVSIAFSVKNAAFMWHCNADTKTTRHFPKSLKPENMIRKTNIRKLRLSMSRI